MDELDLVIELLWLEVDKIVDVFKRKFDHDSLWLRIPEAFEQDSLESVRMQSGGLVQQT